MNNSSDLGFMLLKLTNNNLYDHLLTTVKSFIDHNPFNQIVVFNSSSDRINSYSVPILHLNQAKFFAGDLILFDLASVVLTKNFPNIRKKILYVRDMPWIDSPDTKYSEWLSLYSDTNLELVTQNSQLFDIYELCWKKPIGISENFSYEEFKRFI